MSDFDRIESTPGVSTVQAGEFHTIFNAEREDISSTLNRTDVDLGEAGKRIAMLRSAVVEVVGQLPLYDRGRYEKQLTEMESKVTSLRAKDRPKSKFSFKAKAGPKVTATPVPTASGSGFTATKIEATGSRAASPSHPSSDSAPTASTSTTTISRGPASVKEREFHTPALTDASSTYTISSLSRRLVRPTLPDDTHTYTLTLSDLSECIIDLRPTLTPSTREPAASTSTESSERHEKGPSVAVPTEDEVRMQGGQELVSRLKDEEENTVGLDLSTAPVLTAIHGKGLRRCVLISPIVGGSALLDQVEDSLLVLGAQQFRIHSSTNTTVLLHVASLPVIEHSDKLRFGAYPPVLAGVQNQPTYTSKHAQVQDFDWVRGGPSPHWRSLSDGEWQSCIARLAGYLQGAQDLAAGEGAQSEGTIERTLEQALAS